MPRRRFGATARLGTLIPFFVLATVIGFETPGVFAKDLPELVAISELISSGDRYHGRRVVIVGKLQEIAGEQGRRGSRFYKVIVAAPSERDLSEGQFEIIVFTYDAPVIPSGTEVLVQGTYYREGRWAGKPFERFIESEAILAR